jgi:hypothetical protein
VLRCRAHEPEPDTPNESDAAHPDVKYNLCLLKADQTAASSSPDGGAMGRAPQPEVIQRCKSLRIVILGLGFGTARQKLVLE